MFCRTCICDASQSNSVSLSLSLADAQEFGVYGRPVGSRVVKLCKVIPVFRFEASRRSFMCHHGLETHPHTHPHTLMSSLSLSQWTWQTSNL